jgi:HTH-type transcriptional regulator/antitoxin HipB
MSPQGYILVYVTRRLHMLIRNPRELGYLVKENRKKGGLTQAQLAARVGVSRKWIIDLESGKRTSDLRLVLRALNSVGIDLDAQQRTTRPQRALDINAIVDATKRKK